MTRQTRNTVFDIQGRRWQQKMKSAKLFPTRPRANSSPRAGARKADTAGEETGWQGGKALPGDTEAIRKAEEGEEEEVGERKGRRGEELRL